MKNNYIIKDNSEYGLKVEPGNRLEDYEILQTLGKGSFGFVAKVKSRRDHKLYAMKMIDFSLIDQQDINFAYNEIQIIQSLNSPHITKYYTSFMAQNKLYLIMEFMNNGDLKGYLNAIQAMNKPLTEEEIWEFFYQCSAGLSYIHRNNLIHRDIKPANLFMTDDKTIKIGDFGVSAQKKRNLIANQILNPNSSKETLIVGTPIYMSPEIINHQGYDKKVDVYALGVTFHQICYFSLPRRLAQIVGLQGIGVNLEDIPPERNANLYSKDVYNLIKWMIEKDPNKRPQIYEVFDYIKKVYNSKFKNNSTIDGVYRCLFSFQNLTNYMKRNKNFIKQTAIERPICRSFIYSIKKMDNNDWPTELINLRNILTYENPSFSDPEPINPIELIEFILRRLHKETITKPGITPENPYFFTPDNNPSILTYQQSLNNFLQFNQGYSSCVADFFFGTYEITRFCNNCQKKKFYFSNFTHIIFDIDEALKNGLSENNNLLINYFKKQNSIIRSQLGFCFFCNNNTMHSETQTFFNLPYNLIICFKGEQKTYNNKYIKYQYRVDLSTLGLKSGMAIYNLKGVIKSYIDNEKKYYICIYEDYIKKNWVICDGYTKNFIDSALNHFLGDVIILFYSSLD